MVAKFFGQQEISDQRRMQVDVQSTAAATAVSETVTDSGAANTIPFKYYDTNGVLTTDAGQAAGTPVMLNLSNKNILNDIGDVVGMFGCSSFAWGTGTILVTAQKKPFRGIKAEDAERNGMEQPLAGRARLLAVTAGFKNGDWCLDDEHGIVYGVKATTGKTETVTYKVLVGISGGSAILPSSVNVAQVGGTAVDTNAGTASAGTERVILASGATATRTTVTPSLASQTLKAANTSRKGLRIVSTAVDPTQQIWISIAATATSANFFTKLVGSGEVDLYSSTDWPYNGAWTIISDVASGTLQVIELT